MCDEGEKTCPLCAEEMDLTDQQLKPCKCGYEVCVWCWHHIMEMAEKDETEGRCPACRTPYDKEKIVGTAAKCERLVAEINMEKKMKSQKTKAKVTEVRKQQLSSVRVIQRNLVYIVGLPLNLADEDILQCKEYFGQYGKVLKVSISRTAAGVIQQFPNNTCSVYITYSKEDEAIRCIQSAHGFTLDDRPLRACFGTTKYCHAWLRSVPCNNPDCLYLHEIGSQEDSFTKDEIISAYTRSRVQQVTANTNTMQRHSGTVLPPPVDNYCNGCSASAGKPIVKIPSSSAASVVRESPPNGSTGRSMGLPAAASWGTRGANCSSQAANVEYPNGSSKSTSDPNGPSKSKSDSVSRTSASAATESPNLHGNVVKKPPPLKDGSHIILANTKDTSHVLNSESSLSDKNYGQDGSPASSDRRTSLPTSKDKDSGVPLSRVNSSCSCVELSAGLAEAKGNISNERNVHSLCGDISSLSINRNLHPEPGAQRPETTLVSDPHFIGSPENQGIQQQLCDDHQHEEMVGPVLARKVAPAVGEVYGKTTDKLGSMLSEVEEDILSFDNQRLKDPEVVSHSTYSPSLTTPHHHLPNQFTSNSLQHTNVFGDRRINDTYFLHPPTGLPNGHIGNSQSNSALLQRRMEASHFRTNELQGRHVGISQGDAERNGGLDAGESNIISNILSMDFDPWNDSLTSPHNFAKMFGDTDRQHGLQKAAPSHWKVQSSSQSRFSFARQEDSVSYPPNLEPPLATGFEHMSGYKSIDGEKDMFFHKLGISNGFPSRNSVEPGNMMSSGSHFAASRSPVVPRSQISAPPGFSAHHSKAPPPGFSTTERAEHDSHSGNYRLLDMPPMMLRNASETQMMNGSIGNTVGADIEFMDPAILAVGKGRPQSHSGGGGYDIRSFQQQHILRPPFESDSRFDLLTNPRAASSISAHHQNHHLGGYDIGGFGYSPLSDSSRVLDQLQSPHNLPFAAQMSPFQQQQGRNAAGGHWNGWSDVQSGGGNGGMVMAELLRNERERLGINKQLYSNSNNNGFEDTKYHHRMPTSGDHLYNRTFGM